MRHELDWDRTGEVWSSCFAGRDSKTETYLIIGSEREEEPYLYEHHLMVTLSSGSVSYMRTKEDRTPNRKFAPGLENRQRKPFEQRETWVRVSAAGAGTLARS